MKFWKHLKSQPRKSRASEIVKTLREEREDYEPGEDLRQRAEFLIWHMRDDELEDLLALFKESGLPSDPSIIDEHVDALLALATR